MSDNWRGQIMEGDFVQFSEDGDYMPVLRVLPHGVEYIALDENLETRFAPYEQVVSVVPNDELRAMMGEEF